MTIYVRDRDGGWTPAESVPPSRRLRVDRWLRRHRLGWVARFSRWRDERGLGR